MDNFQTFVLFMFAAVLLVGIAQKIHIPYPIALVIGGTILGLFPRKHPIIINPNLILTIVLPPILYYAAFGISFREFKRNIREITSLALGLVAFTTLVVGVIFKWIFPEYPWALAFAFGAIVSPPDATAATSILKRFSINTRLSTVLEGESLVNDASALVLYRLAVVALFTGTFSIAEAGIDFAKIVSGGIAVGFVLGYLLQNFSRRFLEPAVGVVFSFTIPYITYILADLLDVSGVLAVVVNGLVGSRILVRHYSPLRRILGFAAWDIFIILMNCFVFIMLGLQLGTISKNMSEHEMVLYTGYAFLITFIMLAVRMVWVYFKSGISYIKALRSKHAETRCPEILREAALIGWSGMRGIVSLTAALALPLTLSDGSPLQGRDEVIYLTFVIILLTLVIPGFTLSALIRWLNIKHQTEKNNLIKIREQLAQTADESIHRLYGQKKINSEEYRILKNYQHLQIQALAGSAEHKLDNLEKARDIVMQEKRKKLFELWSSLEIDDRLLTQMEHELDLEETHMTRAELK